MKYLESDNKKPLKEMEKMKIFLTIEGEKREHIWIKKDGDKCYLQNHAILFFPFPSWGLELDFAETIDITKILNKDPDIVSLTFHKDMIDVFANFIDEDNRFLLEKYNKFQEKEIALRRGILDKGQLN